jgi:exopolysaccharide biosynthesis polyprenyl glycosylphosphotransferase
MTPPRAALRAAQSGALSLRPVPIKLVASSVGRMLDSRTSAGLRFLIDVIVLYLAASAALFANTAMFNDGTARLTAAGFPVLVIAILYGRRARDERLHGSLLDTATHVLGVVSLAGMLTIAVDSLLGAAHPLGLALRLWLFSAVYLGVARMVLLSVRRQAIRTEAFATPTLIVGAGIVGEQLVKRLVDEPGYGLRPVGFLDSDPLPRAEQRDSSSVPVLGGPDALVDAVARTGARQVILAFSSEPDHVLVDTVEQCQKLGIDVALVPRLFESINEHATLEHIGPVPLLSLRPTDPRGWQFAVKHTIDRALAALALIMIAPLMLAITIAIRLTSPGPILFRQRRVGRDGHEFEVLKFRTMAEICNSAEFLLPRGCAPGGVEGVDRRTTLGRILRKLSLDELPQFINVLRGDMSLVGPRPERPEYVQRFSTDLERYHDRHRVKSGITGWAQVHGLRGQTSIADRLDWDNWYIQNWSLKLDLRIVAMTVAEVLRMRG